MAELDSPAAVRRVAMDLLARREHSRAELARKLSQRGAPEELLESVLDRLAEDGLLSDARYLESAVRKRVQAGCGPLRIREELSRAGIARADLEQALYDESVDWMAELRRVWQRKFAGELPRDARERARQGRFLAYRGFPPDLIGQLWRTVRDD